jgi:predicted transcriptional regulator
MEISESKSICVLTSVLENEVDILKRHIQILKAVLENEPIGIIKLSEITHHPQHMVRYSLRMLEHEGLIKPSSRGAVTTDKVPETMKILKEVLDKIKTDIDELRKTL